ncbi:unnamed protein product [Clavelina lepadiformis]|uniref:GOST seven transmembrane domain-containing protein n=1 Tax=Clavelina lepadiformis TaxID=159417 RepID=A0ABP0F6G0_CLALP
MYYNTFMWTEIIVFVDILCFGIILISVVWSVRHLQDASKTDGKAAINLTKLKLFQQFYVMVICYLYFRRVIVYMLKVTLPFRYTWIHLFVYELVSVVFFIVTGYKFRPGCDNPYLSVPQDDDDIESHALTESGVTETIAKVNQYPKESLSGKENESLLPKQRTKNSIL